MGWASGAPKQTERKESKTNQWEHSLRDKVGDFPCTESLIPG